MAVSGQLDSLEQGFRMGGWHVRPLAGQLWPVAPFWMRRSNGDGSRRHVEPKAIRVLLELATRQGEFISKDELIQAAWDGRPVSDDVLTRAIHALRAALDDDPRDPHFIETRSNVGYRLLVRVRAERSRALRRLAPVAPVVVMGIAAWLMLIRPGPFDDEPMTIAVLPFLDISAAEDTGYLSAAMTESLILNLSRLPEIRVISRTSVMPFADHVASAENIAQQLGADLLVEGSVQTANGQLRVVAQLIEPYEDGHLWADHFDRPMDDVLALQQEISNAIATHIGRVVVAPAASLSHPLPAAAMQNYLHARYLLARANVASVESALTLFDGLTHRFPAFAPAHLGRAQSLLVLFKAHARDRAALELALDAGLAFEALAGANSESHRCIGQLRLLSDWDFDGAELRYHSAITLNPSDTVARRRFAWLLVGQQQYERAAREIHQIRLLDPLYYTSAEMAALLLYSGQVDAAVQEFERLEKTTELNKSVLRTMAVAYLAAGRDRDAHDTLVRMLESAGLINEEGAALFRTAATDELYRYIIEVSPFKSPIAAAGFHNLAGNTEAALGNLEQAVTQRDPYALYLGALPELASLHGEPRFTAILARVGVVPENLDHLRETRLVSANLNNPQAKPHDN